MKRIVLTAIVLITFLTGYATHITGGEMYYTFAGKVGSLYRYNVTLKLYRDCSATTLLDQVANIGIFDNASPNSPIKVYNIKISDSADLTIKNPDPCITNPPYVCYQVGFYRFVVEVPSSTAGYTLAFQRCCRINGINNLSSPSNEGGATYTAQIPGISQVTTGPANNSARFTGKDTVVTCANNAIYYDFSAIDSDSTDNLRYYFCQAYSGGGQATGTGPYSPVPAIPLGPPYSSVSYSAGFSAESPLGPGVTINKTTGVLSGIAPAAGIYVVTVCVDEIRDGKVIATQRKDLQIKVADCSYAGADLPEAIPVCDSSSYKFINRNNSPLNKTWFWDFGDGTTSTETNPTHVYADTGSYVVKLYVNRGQQCSDSAFTVANVFPGFDPGFTTFGGCVNKPLQFTDTTYARYGVVNSWSWNFGDLTTLGDTANTKAPTYTYSQTGIKNVMVVVGSSKGCTKTYFKDIEIFNKPPLDVSFSDTLICNGDTLKLQAIGDGIFSWTPVYRMFNPNTAEPSVYPDVTTEYIVRLDYQDCYNFDTVRVNVVNFVTLSSMPDTTICLGDSAQLRLITNGLQFEWTPVDQLDNARIKNPMALPPATTNYHVIARIGHCLAEEDISVRTVPYPVANAGPDTTICYKSDAFINGSMTGTHFTWTPTFFLRNANTLNPISTARDTIAYVLTVWDSLSGCPKPKYDTTIVNVWPEIFPHAGGDTAVIVEQPVQLTATGGVSYQWTPATGLSDATIGNPVARYTGSFDSIRYKVYVTSEFGCIDSTSLLVKIFRTPPKIFVPTAFTPNNDGNNDVIRPIAAGIAKIEYFRIYNRWGELVFSTNINGAGWDGRINGKPQGTNVYVWIVKAVDYKGEQYVEKGTVTLIR